MRTRAHSRSARIGSGMCSTTWEASRKSNASSSNGSAIALGDDVHRRRPPHRSLLRAPVDLRVGPIDVDRVEVVRLGGRRADLDPAQPVETLVGEARVAPQGRQQEGARVTRHEGRRVVHVADAQVA